MTKEQVTQQIRAKIAISNIGEALRIFSEYISGKNKKLEYDLLLLTARFNANESAYFLGTLRQDYYEQTKAHINQGLTFLLRQIPDTGNGTDEPTIQHPVDRTTRSGGNKIIRILFVAANPDDHVQLDLEKEIIKILNILSRSRQAHSIVFNLVTSAKILDFIDAVQRLKPNIVHFSGHGAGRDGIVFENEKGESSLLNANALERLFKRFKSSVSCVVLNACHSHRQAIPISRQGIYVLGMNDAIGDKAAIDMSAGFYQSIGTETDYETAFDMAMVNIAVNRLDIDIPELWYNGEQVKT